MRPDVCVVIPTFRRPEGVRRALSSVFLQDGVQALVEIVVLDNDPDASARQTVKALAAGARWPVIYGHEPEPGVANARNAALRLTKARLIAFLDDDEYATPGWLEGLLDTRECTNADLVFGPVQGRLDGKTPHRRYIEARFSRTGPAQSGCIEDYHGCGNSLLKRDRFFSDPPLFDPANNEIGGEDDALFSKAKADGAVIAWAAQALVYEDIPPERATLTYAMAKAFAFGQGPTQTCWQHRKVLGVLYWMAVGLGQASVFGALYALRRLAGAKGQPEMLDRAAQGLGKLLWFKGLEPRFYGAAAL